MKDFYDDDDIPGLTLEEVKMAVRNLKSPDSPFESWDGGDLIDRERARDLILTSRGKKAWGTKAPE